MSWKLVGRALVTLASAWGIFDVYKQIDESNDLIGEYDPEHDPRSIWEKIYSNLRHSVVGTSINEKLIISGVIYALWKYQDVLLKARKRQAYSF